jgi:hypothetical protein
MITETEDKPEWVSDLSCTFCGPGTWASWDVVIEDGVFFVCDRHHAEMSQAKIIQLERRMGEKTWRKFSRTEMIYEEVSDDLTGPKDPKNNE